MLSSIHYLIHLDPDRRRLRQLSDLNPRKNLTQSICTFNVHKLQGKMSKFTRNTQVCVKVSKNA